MDPKYPTTSKLSQQFGPDIDGGSVRFKDANEAEDEVETFLKRIGLHADIPVLAASAQAISIGQQRSSVGLHNLGEHISEILETRSAETEREWQIPSECDGRIGPSTVVLDMRNKVGSFNIEQDQLGVTSSTNFSTIRANACVYKGKWLYELMLGSKGLMQVGWCTLKCIFSTQEGVGDTANSFAYDGYRQKKWNERTMKYGESWFTGDVITCAIDMDEGTMTFYRNGRSMGVAFSDIPSGPGCAYFPAVSLSIQENLIANFGDTPLRYPVEGYRPMQLPPRQELIKAAQLMKCHEHLLDTMIEIKKKGSDERSSLTKSNMNISNNVKMVVAAHIFNRLAPLLCIPYITEAVLLRSLLKYCNTSRHCAQQPYITKILQIMWMFMEESELKQCLENLMVILLKTYRFSPVESDFKHQQTYLLLTLSLLRHEPTRKLALQHILFDKIKFAIFMDIKPPDDIGLAELIPKVWWEKVKKDCSKMPQTAFDDANRKLYERSCSSLKMKITELEEIQVEILKLLLNDHDVEYDTSVSSRSIFLTKFKLFLKENNQDPRNPHNHGCPLSVVLCFYHRLIVVLQHYWDVYADNTPQTVHCEEAYVPTDLFVDEKPNDSLDHERLGGSFTYVKKSVSISDEILKELPPSSPSLVKILDGVIMMYPLAVHKHFIKMSNLKENLQEFVIALTDTEDKIRQCAPHMGDVHDELKHSETVLKYRTSEHARHTAWVNSVIFSKDKQEQIHWMLRVILRTLEQADHKSDLLLSYIPEFYIDACLDAYKCLQRFFNANVPFASSPGYSTTLLRMAVFLSKHFCNSQIINTDMKDKIIQSLGWFVCFPDSLRSLEQMPLENRQTTAKSLLQPYQYRSWPQVNWLLVRLWKGCGFAYRYEQPPHISLSKLMNRYADGIEIASLQRPCPSVMYQQHIGAVLMGDEVTMVNFLNSAINQLNWAFSEFLAFLKEVHGICTNKPRSVIETSQQKLCATCFDLTVGLLRVLELVISVAPELFTDWSRPSAETMLVRLVQLISQLLSRITADNNIFHEIVSMKLSALDSVDYYPILTAVAGILTKLLTLGPPTSHQCCAAALVHDPGFDIGSLHFLLSGSRTNQPSTCSSSRDTKNTFSLRNYKEVSANEITLVKNMISTLTQEQENKPSIAQMHVDEICTICYANVITAKFFPCNHTSCRACIDHQLMNKKECFFCKSPVERVDRISPDNR